MPRRGHGWSKQGSKASRRAKRNSRRRQWYYAVAIGHRPGIYLDWPSAKAQVHQYPNNIHAKFLLLDDARRFMSENREFPPAVRTPFPPHSDTPLPPPEINPVYRTQSEETDLHVDVDCELQMPPYIAVGPADVSPESFIRVREISERIANNPANRVLDPPSFECSNTTCGFCHGDPMAQRYALMKRLFQLNAQLVRSDGAGGTRPGQLDHTFFG